MSSVGLCCSSVGRVNEVGRKIVTLYGPEIEIDAQAYVDDVESAGSIKVANNTIFNCSIIEKEKQLTINTDLGKSALMIVHGKKGNKSLTECVQRGRISVVNEYCYLGTWIDEEASYMTNIKKIRGKVQAMINTTKQV